MKHYTLEKAIEKANAEGLGQPQRDYNLEFFRGMENAVRMFFGYKPRVFYFPDNDAIISRRKLSDCFTDKYKD